MPTALDPTLQPLDDCGCCAGTAARTPVEVENRPGLAAVAYRVGTHATFLASMKAALTSADRPALGGLTAREDDFSAALLDAWATVGDVLTFYQERIAAESYLRTATERRSVLELARSIGYELNPGVAAATWLAFSLEDAPGAPEEVELAVGTRVQSVPGPGELPQTFETTEAVPARPVWNELLPRLSRPQELASGSTGVWVKGTTTALLVGDAVLVVDDDRLEKPDAGSWDVRVLRKVAVDRDGDRTWLGWDPPLGGDKATVDPKRNPRVFALRQRAALFGHNAPDFRLMHHTVQTAYQRSAPKIESGSGGSSEIASATASADEWPNFDPPATDGGETDLDAVYPRVLPESWMVVRCGADETLHRVTGVREAGVADFGLSGKVTRVKLDTTAGIEKCKRREAVVFVQSEELPLADEPIPDAVWGDRIELDRGLVPPLEPGRKVIVRGLRARAVVRQQLQRRRPQDPFLSVSGPGGAPRALLSIAKDQDAPAFPQARRLRLRDAKGVETAVSATEVEFAAAEEGDEEGVEVAEVKECRTDDPEHTLVIFTRPLANAYDRPTARVLGNVAFATHGESVAERLGSGDGAREYQRFALRQAPLTHVPDDSPGGGASTLEVRVGELRWDEVPTLFGAGPRDRVYTTRRQDDGATVVQFGDGRSGARLPTGRENVSAAYRKGIGRVGNLRAGQLTLLMTRALGLRSVENPIAATGGTDPQEMADARDNAPLTVLTMDRIVSLRDYQDFARSFVGVAKAHAVWTWDGDRRGVLITVAGPEGDAVPAGGPVHASLLAAARKAGDAHVPVRVLSYRPVRFRVGAVVKRDPAYLAETVKAAADAALLARFSFAARAFGARVSLGDVVATLQGAAGVVAVDVNLLYAAGDSPAFGTSLEAKVPAPGAVAHTAAPADLLTIDLRPGDVVVTD